MFPLEKASRLHPRICPTVGAGSSRFSRRFPRPTSPQAAWIFFVATWRTASRFIARPSGLPGVCSDVACRTSLLCVPHRLCGSCRGLFTEFTYPCVQVAIRGGAVRLGQPAPVVQALRQDFCIDTATGWPHSILHRCRPESNHPGWLDGSPRQGDG